MRTISAPASACRLNLRQRRLYIRGQRIGHRLNGDRRIAPDRHIAHHDLARGATVDVAPRADVIEAHTALLRQEVSTKRYSFSNTIARPAERVLQAGKRVIPCLVGGQRQGQFGNDAGEIAVRFDRGHRIGL